MTPEEIARLPYRPCVGIMLVNADGSVFTGQRIDRDTDAWQMPQGGIDKGETPREAALRELEEEIGVPSGLVEILAETGDWLTYDLPHHIVPNIWKGRFRGQKQKWVLMRFEGSDDQVNIQTAQPEFSSWRWQPKDTLLASIVDFKREVYAEVLKEFGPLF